jgi:hypothetical protein
MIKRIGIVLAAVLLLAASGCSSGAGSATSTSTQPAGIKEVRQADIGNIWTVTQLEVNLESTTSILFKLAPGAEVNGYFYLTKGNNVDFRVSGLSLIYQSVPLSASANITSDRFSFTADSAQGIAYTLQLIPDEKAGGKKVTPTVFLEVIYPAAGEIFVPMETK